MILANSAFFRYQYFLNMAEALHYFLNIVWARKLNHNKDSRHVHHRQTDRLCKLRHLLIYLDMKLTVSSAWGTLHC